MRILRSWPQPGRADSLSIFKALQAQTHTCMSHGTPRQQKPTQALMSPQRALRAPRLRAFAFALGWPLGTFARPLCFGCGNLPQSFAARCIQKHAGATLMASTSLAVCCGHCHRTHTKLKPTISPNPDRLPTPPAPGNLPRSLRACVASAATAAAALASGACGAVQHVGNPPSIHEIRRAHDMPRATRQQLECDPTCCDPA